MRVLVVGLGVQGAKRKAVAGADCVGAVDPFNAAADWRDVRDVPVDCFDAAIACIPDEPKIEVLSYLLGHGKHVLVEKPLWAPEDKAIENLEGLARKNRVLCRTAYNHRFEPHFVRMRDLIASGRLGKIYRCRMFYGNGTARLVRESAWRDAGSGVLHDLGSHLLDTLRFWFGAVTEDIEVYSSCAFENRAPDHVVLGAVSVGLNLEVEMTLLSWRNHFTCDIFAENGSAHIESLCKWGPSQFVERTRVLPSGRPPESAITLVQADPTWAAEYADFVRACAQPVEADLSSDIWLNGVLRKLGKTAIDKAKVSP